jgi:hypothetical protein
VKHHIAIQIRRQSWAIAALFFIAFCGLGFVAVNFGALFQGFDINYLPAASRFAVAHGPIAFPLFGIIAATAVIFSDAFRLSRWLQWGLVALFAFLVSWALWAFSGIFMRFEVLSSGPALF